MFKIILRTFEAEILKIFKNIQPQLKNETFLYKKRECISIGKFQNQTKAVFAFSAHWMSLNIVVKRVSTRTTTWHYVSVLKGYEPTLDKNEELIVRFQ